MANSAGDEGKLVLICAPFGRDGTSIATVLEREGIRARRVVTIDEIADGFGDEVGLILLAEEALSRGQGRLSDVVAAQPDWSDVPFVLIAAQRPDREPRPVATLRRLLPATSNVIMLDRPLGVASLVSTVSSALLSRARQFERRDQVAALAASQAALADRENRLRLATDAGAIGTWDYDPVNDGLQWDARCRDLFGVPREGPVSYEDAFKERLHPDDRERTEAAVSQALAPGGNGRYDVEFRVGDRWIAANGAAVFVDGVAVRFIGTVIDVSERKRAEARLAASEAYWRGLFARLQEGILIGRVVRDANGRVVDWRYVDVNPAWAALTGFSSDQALGKSVRELLPGIEDIWIDEPGYVVDSGEPVTFTRPVGELGRWYEGRVAALDSETFIALFLDVTERRKIEDALVASGKRKAALARLGDHLRATLDANAMSYAAAAIAGEALGASQTAYATIDVATEVVRIESPWCAPGVPSLVGTHDFRAYGFVIDDLKAGRVVAISDVENDKRTRDQIASFRAIGVKALVDVPIIEKGELVAMFFAVFAEQRTLEAEEEDFIRVTADRTRAGMARAYADERQAVLNGEISHRLKNTLSIVQAIANQTLKGASDREAVSAFDQRLMALSTAHDVLLQKDWDAADLAEVLRRVLDAAGAGGRYEATGPAAVLGPRAALSTSLLFHELATNASKYGALTQAGGKIEVRWNIETSSGTDELVLDWREIGGPPAAEPSRKGFGSRLLKMGLVGTGGSHLYYKPTGLEATFRAPRTQVEQA